MTVATHPRLVGLVLAGGAPRVGVEPFFMELIAGMEEALSPSGATVLLLVAPDVESELAIYRRWAADHTVEAVVVVNVAHDDTRPAELAALRLPAVLAGSYPGPVPLTRVLTDDAGAMVAAMELLASLGHRAVGRVSGPAELVHTAERTAAMHTAGERLGIEVRIVEADYSAEAGVRGARRLLAADGPVTAVIFDNDVMAVAAEQDLVQSGVPVPGRLSLLGYDDSPLCELADPPLSVLSIDVHEHGVLLGRVVLDVLAGAAPRDHAGPAFRILRRGSTGPAPATLPHR
jgi:DNA-binding LacI/PurR family transcriptional regulator